MTRRSLNRTLSLVYAVLALVLVLAFGARFARFVPWLPQGVIDFCGSLYDYMREMAPLLIAVLATYLANALQKRSKFTAGLEQEWRNIVATKSALYQFCEKPYPTAEDYIAAFCRISDTIDNMRIVYGNVGETDELIGLYPYMPLHDMRRALQTLDPRKNKAITPEYRKLVRDAILQCFYALRQTFLEELDIEQPTLPVLVSGARRLPRSGATAAAKRLEERQRLALETHAETPGTHVREDLEGLLRDLYEREQAEQRAAAGR